MAALTSYARYGKNSRFRDVVSKERLLSAKAVEFVSMAKNIVNAPYEVFFYGKDLEKFKKNLSSIIKKSNAKYDFPAAKIYTEPNTDGKVYFTNYDMVQVEMSKVGRGETVDLKDFGKSSVFNEYFGSGLSFIVFQEIREARSLAYSAYVNY